MSRSLRIDVYADTVCPWCYLGARRLDAALTARPQYAHRITWRPFELNPDLPLEGVRREDFIAARIADPQRMRASEQSLVELGRPLDIVFRFERIERMPNTRRSHLLLALAARRGLQRTVLDRFMRAYFEEGRDVGDPEELVRLATEAGLDEREAARTLVLRSGQDAVLAAERHAAGLGLSGVPAFVINGEYLLSGAREPEELIAALDQVGSISAESDAS
ncbi:MAG: DsbA family oxidoreductase [Gammaproteobacteria bacterium]|nr:DsbA family oxidoreductase [Gammaproteobacteria bacterium]